MLIGAPKAQTNLQPGIIKGGAVYRCSIEDQRCQIIPFDLRGKFPEIFHMCIRFSSTIYYKDFL